MYSLQWKHETSMNWKWTLMSRRHWENYTSRTPTDYAYTGCPTPNAWHHWAATATLIFRTHSQPPVRFSVLLGQNCCCIGDGRCRLPDKTTNYESSDHCRQNNQQHDQVWHSTACRRRHFCPTFSVHQCPSCNIAFNQPVPDVENKESRARLLELASEPA